MQEDDDEFGFNESSKKGKQVKFKSEIYKDLSSHGSESGYSDKPLFNPELLGSAPQPGTGTQDYIQNQSSSPTQSINDR